MMTPERIRIADQGDEEDLVRLCLAVHAEMPTTSGIDLAKVRMELREAYVPPPILRSAIIGVIGGRGAPMEGAIFMTFFQEWFSSDFGCHEMFNFVYPEFRKGTTNSKDLIAWADSTAKQLGLPLEIGILSNHRTEAKIRHYRQRFGDFVGVRFRGGYSPETEVA